jgi:YidC/Oxa1 family membrane protein insertase
MDNSSKRVLLAVVLSIGLFLLWDVLVMRRQQPVAPPPTSAQPAAERPSAAKAPIAAGSGGDVRAASPATADRGAVARDALGRATTLQWRYGEGSAKVTLTDHGAALQSLVFGDPRFRELQEGRLQPIDLVQTLPSRGPWPLTTTFPDSDFVVPDDAEFSLVERGPQRVRYAWSSARVRVVKDFVLDRARPVIWMSVTVHNLSAGPLRQRMKLQLFARQRPGQSEGGMTDPYPRIPTGMCHINGELQRRSVNGALGQPGGGCSEAGCGAGSGPVGEVGPLRWIASDDRYFMVAVVPQGKVAEGGRCEIGPWRDRRDVVEVSLLLPEQQIEAGRARTRRFAVFVGPKDLRVLDGVAGAGGEEARLGDAIEFGWLALLCRPMLAVLKVFQRLTGNWGVAIILLTLLVKLATAYWSTRSMKSMREMQRLKPKVDLLREKYKDDKQRLNQELMGLYRVHKVNPLGGCLPMLIQMPIWFALYRTLGNAQELYRSGFFGWIDDLTAPDRFYVLPLALGVAMFGQQAITPQPMEAAQAKAMKYIMPVMFTAMMLWLPSGLNLYIFVNTVLTMLHQWFMNRGGSPPTVGSAPSGGAGERAPGHAAGRPKSDGVAARGRKHTGKRR